MSLGKKLYQLRSAKNLTKEKVAEQIGVSKTAYGKWESDLAKPNFDNIAILCNFYSISKDELMNSDQQSVNLTNNTFNNSPNVINSPNPTINCILPNEIIEKILENQKVISEYIENLKEKQS